MTENPPPPRDDPDPTDEGRTEGGDTSAPPPNYPPPGNYPPSGPPSGHYPPPPSGTGGYGTPPPHGGEYGPPQGPPPGYGPPPGQYGAPPGQYGRPEDQYGPPQGQYGPPPGQYGSPQGQYGSPQGQYGSPQGQYGSPPGGSSDYGAMPPPPPGEFGAPPGYGASGPGGYGATAFGAPVLSVGDALRYGWEKYKSNAGVWIGISLIAVLIDIAVRFPFGGFNYDTNSLSSTFRVWNIIGALVGFVVGVLIQAAFVKGALHEVDGRRPSFGSFFQFNNVGAVILASVLVGVATTIGFFLCILPGIAIAFLTWFTLQFVLDQNQDAITGIKSSYEVISKNVGPLVLLALACIGLNIVGALLCLVGLLVSIPVTLIASTYAYRLLVRGPVSPATA